jgi:hypothetical protein
LEKHPFDNLVLVEGYEGDYDMITEPKALKVRLKTEEERECSFLGDYEEADDVKSRPAVVLEAFTID